MWDVGFLLILLCTVVQAMIPRKWPFLGRSFFCLRHHLVLDSLCVDWAAPAPGAGGGSVLVLGSGGLIGSAMVKVRSAVARPLRLGLMTQLPLVPFAVASSAPVQRARSEKPDAHRFARAPFLRRL
jgi:hypothetical protein